MFYQGQFDSARFSWRTQEQDIRQEPHLLRLKVTDHGYPFTRSTYHNLTIYVKKDTAIQAWVSTNAACGQIQLKVDSFKTAGNPSFNWNFNNDTSSQSQTFILNVDSNGSFPFQLFITSELSCDTFYYNDTLEISDIANVEIAAPDSVCPNSAFVLRASANGGSIPYKFTWSLSDTTYTADSVEYMIPHDTTVHIKFINAEGCTARDSVKIIAFPISVLTCPASFDICANAAEKNLTNICGYQGEWQGPGVIDSTFYPAIADTGNHLLYFAYTDSFQCVYKDTVTVTVKTRPDVKLKSLPSLCINSDTLSLLSYATPLNGTWSGPGIESQLYFNPSKAGAGSHQVIYIYQGANGCYGSDSVQAVVNAIPAVNAGMDYTICLNEITNLGGQPSGGNWSGPGISGTDSFIAAGAGIGNYNLVYSFTDTTGCTAKDSLRVNVKGLPTIVAGADFTLCPDAKPMSLNGAPAGGTWSGTGVTGNKFNPAAAGAGIYPLVYKYVDGCSNTDTLIATVLRAPVASAGADTAFCFTNEPVTLKAVPVGGTWSGTGIQNNTFYASISGAGTFALTYSFTDTSQCSATDSMEATVYPLPQFTPSFKVINPPGEVEFSLATTNMLSSYFWYFGDGGTSNLASPVYDYGQEDTTYDAYVAAQNQYQCSDTVYFKVVIEPTGVEETNPLGLTVFPNPVSKNLNIRVRQPLQNCEILLLSAQGKLILRQQKVTLAAGETFSLDMHSLSKGTYLLQVISKKSVETVKVIK